MFPFWAIQVKPFIFYVLYNSRTSELNNYLDIGYKLSFIKKYLSNSRTSSLMLIVTVIWLHCHNVLIFYHHSFVLSFTRLDWTLWIYLDSGILLKILVKLLHSLKFKEWNHQKIAVWCNYWELMHFTSPGFVVVQILSWFPCCWICN